MEKAKECYKIISEGTQDIAGEIVWIEDTLENWERVGGAWAIGCVVSAHNAAIIIEAGTKILELIREGNPEGNPERSPMLRIYD
ncbi:MAG: hypothetical protein LBJ92_01005 [Holosporales bacterium]|jgi:hypothetical protein|nr:hypothetical protein [Holosporales bacterium]